MTADDRRRSDEAMALAIREQALFIQAKRDARQWADHDAPAPDRLLAWARTEVDRESEAALVCFGSPWETIDAVEWLKATLHIYRSQAEHLWSDAHRDEARRLSIAFSNHCGSCGGDGTHPPRLGFDAIEASWIPSITCESCGGDGGLISAADRAELLAWVTDRIAWHRCDVADMGECSRDELVDWLTDDLGVPAGPIVDACLGTNQDADG